MTSEKRAQKIHTDDASLPRSRELLIQTIRSTTQIWVGTRHQYGISVLVSQTSLGGENSVRVAKCRLFSQATKKLSRNILKIVVKWTSTLTLHLYTIEFFKIFIVSYLKTFCSYFCLLNYYITFNWVLFTEAPLPGRRSKKSRWG